MGSCKSFVVGLDWARLELFRCRFRRNVPPRLALFKSFKQVVGKDHTHSVRVVRVGNVYEKFKQIARKYICL